MRTETIPEQRAELRRICGLGYRMTPETKAAVLALLDERDALAAELADSAATKALDAIAALSGCAEWEYPGQVVRDVEAMAARIAELEAEAKASSDDWEEDIAHLCQLAGVEATGPALLEAAHGIPAMRARLAELEAELAEAKSETAAGARLFAQATDKINGLEAREPVACETCGGAGQTVSHHLAGFTSREETRPCTDCGSHGAVWRTT